MGRRLLATALILTLALSGNGCMTLGYVFDDPHVLIVAAGVELGAIGVLTVIALPAGGQLSFWGGAIVIGLPFLMLDALLCRIVWGRDPMRELRAFGATEPSE